MNHSTTQESNPGKDHQVNTRKILKTFDSHSPLSGLPSFHKWPELECPWFTGQIPRVPLLVVIFARQVSFHSPGQVQPAGVLLPVQVLHLSPRNSLTPGSASFRSDHS